MKKQLFLGLLAFGMLYSCQSEIVEPISLEKEALFARSSTASITAPEVCGETISTDIFTRKMRDVGQFTASNDETNLYITLSTERKWKLRRVP